MQMRLSSAGFSVGCLVFLSFTPFAVQANEDYTAPDFGVSTELKEQRERHNREAMSLLNRMRKALHELSYRGTLVYRHNESLSTLQIDHSVINGVARERVVRLNEQGSEISRELKGFSLTSIPVIRPEMGRVYSFDIGRENRVANIPCRIITVRPKDRARYLQKFCIDPQTGLLLDYMLVGKTHNPVEQFMFTSIEIQQPEKEMEMNPDFHSGSDERIKKSQPVQPADTTALLSANANSGLTENSPLTPSMSDSLRPVSAPVDSLAAAIPDNAVVPLTQADTTVITPAADANESSLPAKTLTKNRPSAHSGKAYYQLDEGWIMQSLPAGFEIRQAREMKPLGSSERDVTLTIESKGAVTRHYVVSDGMSSLSVFIAPVTIEIPNYAIQATSGALNVISLKKEGQWVTAVGEVPESTLKTIVNNLRYLGNDSVESGARH